jgi:hypothetical protein
MAGGIATAKTQVAFCFFSAEESKAIALQIIKSKKNKVSHDERKAESV